MRNISMLILILAGFAAPLAMAADSKIDITSPADGAKLDSKAQNKIDYNITLAGAGNHIHIYVDGEKVALLRQMKGSYTFESLAKGKREICIKIVDSGHTPIGTDRCVKVTVE